MSRLCAFVGVLAALCYLNTLGGSFVHDDRMVVVENADVDPGRSAWTDLLFNDYWGTPIRFGLRLDLPAQEHLTRCTI